MNDPRYTWESIFYALMLSENERLPLKVSKTLQTK